MPIGYDDESFEEIDSTYCSRCHATLSPGHEGVRDGDDFICSHCVDAERIVVEVEEADAEKHRSAHVTPGYYRAEGLAHLLKLAFESADWEAVLCLADALDREGARRRHLYE